MVDKRYSLENVINDVTDTLHTQSQFVDFVNCLCYLLPESKNIKDASLDEFWISAVPEELTQFARPDVWTFVPRPSRTNVTGTKLVFRNKIDNVDNIVMNKARLVAQGYGQRKVLSLLDYF